MYRIKRGAHWRLFVSKEDVFGSILLSVLAVALYVNIYRIAPLTVAALPPASSAAVSEKVIDTPVSQDISTDSTTIPIKVLQALAAIPDAKPAANCSVASTYTTPGALTLGDASPALTTTIDTPGYYQIYGNSLASLRSAIQSCDYRAKVAGSYHAVTARNINWSYSFSQTADSCTLQNLHVGLHIAQLMPTYTPTSETPENVVAIWDRYAKNLKTHEDGHVALAEQYTAELTAKLQSIGPLRCDLLRSQVAVIISSQITLLNTEDKLYDARTNHGATQGAVL